MMPSQVHYSFSFRPDKAIVVCLSYSSVYIGRFSSPQAFMQSRTDRKLSPSSVKVYSTRGGTSQKSWRRIKPSVSSSRSCFVRELSVISPIWRRSCPNLLTSHLPIYQRSSILYFPPNSFCTMEIVLHRLIANSDFRVYLISLPYHHTLFCFKI